jgi:hypothetical protein
MRDRFGLPGLPDKVVPSTALAAGQGVSKELRRVMAVTGTAVEHPAAVVTFTRQTISTTGADAGRGLIRVNDLTA